MRCSSESSRGNETTGRRLTVSSRFWKPAKQVRLLPLRQDGGSAGAERCLASNSRRVQLPYPPQFWVVIWDQSAFQTLTAGSNSSTTRERRAPAMEPNAVRTRRMWLIAHGVRFFRSPLWPRRLLARLAPSHGAGPGSIPGGVTRCPYRLSARMAFFQEAKRGSIPR